jgi:phenylpropionate dioxygenase-like ring-hydroxylating dioxygenase large terminal subunit
MGDLFRRFWVPVLLAEELPGPDCTPVRVRIFGENLVAFRDSNGDVGLMEANYPHRGAPLFFGRNEEAGLRCIYHGWKFNAAGVCIDLPNAAEGESFKQKIKIIAYPTVEAGDIIWAYMGPEDKKPPFPEFDWAGLPKSHRYVSKFGLECNWLQAMEGDFDPSHAVFLHSALDNRGQESNGAGANLENARRMLQTPASRIVGSADPNEPYPRAVGNRRVTEDHIRGPQRVRLESMDAALFAMSSQELPDGRKSARAGLVWQMPMYCPPGVSLPGHLANNIRVPIDNEHTMFYRLRWALEPMTEKDIHEYKHGGYTFPELIPGTWNTRANVHNDYEIDRVVQKNFSYSGIKNFPLQDIAMMEDQWGPVADRTREHLTSMDYQIIHVRRRLIAAVRELQEGVEPSEPWKPEAYRYHTAAVTVESGSLEEALELAKEKARASLRNTEETDLKQAALQAR